MPPKKAKVKPKNADEAMKLMEKGYGLFVSKGRDEAQLRPLKGAGATPIPVLIQSAKLLIENSIVALDGPDGMWDRFKLTGKETNETPRATR